MSKNKKPFKETRVGKFLTEKAPNLAGDILAITGDITGVDMLKNIGTKIKGSSELSEHDKEMALRELDMDIKEMEEVTKRWQADMNSDSWLSKNVRPLVVIWLVVFVSLFAFMDSLEKVAINVGENWVDLFSTLLVTTIVAYFGSRGYEKGKNVFKK